MRYYISITEPMHLEYEKSIFKENVAMVTCIIYVKKVNFKVKMSLIIKECQNSGTPYSENEKWYMRKIYTDCQLYFTINTIRGEVDGEGEGEKVEEEGRRIKADRNRR